MLRQALAFAVAVGLVGAFAIPAYAVVQDPAVASSTTERNAPAQLALAGQGIDIAEGEAPVIAERDTLTGLPGQPTAEDLAAAYRLSGGTISWPLGDDYYLKDSPNGYGMSPMGYGIRTCTDFVAWRLNRDAGSFGAPWLMPWGYLTPTGGEASSWAEAWTANGWASSTTPVAGAVAWFGYGANHVAYVNAVNDDGTITIEEYNWTPLTYGSRTVDAASIPLYLYPPPRP
ncbi:MAG: CHAP domain-containing protein [Microbacteriaceae bacterium]|nr:CHAP domain-containing protein [Microbacteriaceae bacterium]